MLSPRTLMLWAAAALSAACSDAPGDTSDAGVPAPDAGVCGAGLRAMGPACVPVMDTCKANEVPVPGGGCKAVGPPTQCSKGWKLTADGWCEPLLPSGKCTGATMAVPGKATCQPVGDCGSGTYGRLKTAADTIHVDQAAATGGDGSAASPYRTINAALTKGKAGAPIAVAAGTYDEQVELFRKVTLEGRCAAKVIITGGGKDPAVRAHKWASGSVMRGVTVTSKGKGIEVQGVDLTLERIIVSKSLNQGIYMSTGKLTLRDSLVDSSQGVGVALHASTATLERVVVRRTGTSAGGLGVGVLSSILMQSATPSRVSLSDCLLDGNGKWGLAVLDSEAKLTRTVVRDTLDPGGSGAGLYALHGEASRQRPRLELDGCVILGNRRVGIEAYSADVLIKRSIIRDTLSTATSQAYGLGLMVAMAKGFKMPKVTISDSLVLRNQTAGLFLSDAVGTVSRTVIRDNYPSKDMSGGEGIRSWVSSLRTGADLQLTDSVVTGNHAFGVALNNSATTIERSVISDTRALPTTKKLGIGIYAFPPSKTPGQKVNLKLVDSQVAGNRMVGVAMEDASGELQRVVISGTKLTAAGTLGMGLHVNKRAGAAPSLALSVTDSLVQGGHSAGVSVFGRSVSLRRTAVAGVKADASGTFGDGLLAAASAQVTLAGCQFSGSARAGLLYDAAGGSVGGTVIRDNDLAVVLENGASPTLGEGNVLSGNKSNKVSHGLGLKSLSVPDVPDPFGKK